MTTKFVKVLCDVDCKWAEINPKYRVFVNKELFAERTWIWSNFYLEEMLQINATSGKYPITFELVEPHTGELIIKNLRIGQGEARIIDNNVLEIFE